MAHDPQTAAPEIEQQPPVVVRGALGELVTVPPKSTANEVMGAMQNFYNENPDVLGEFHKRKQQQGALDVDGNPILPHLPSPEARRAFLVTQLPWGLKPGGLDDMAVMFGLGRTDSPVEMLVALRQNYPDAEIQLIKDIDGSSTIAIRKKGETFGVEVDAPEFGPGDLAMLASGVISEDVVLEILAMMATRTSLGSVKGLMFKAFAAAAAGEGIKSLVERARGRELSTKGAIAERIFITGLFGGAGTAIFDGTARARNIIKGVQPAKGGIVTLSPQARRGQESSARLGLDQPLPGDLHPKFRAGQRQAQTINTKLEMDVDSRLARAATKLQDDAAAIGDVSKLTDQELTNIVAKQEAKFTQAIDVDPNMTFERSGGKVQMGLNKLDELLAEFEGRDYVKALNVSEKGSYDIGPIKKIMANLKFGVRAPVTFKGKGWTLHTSINVNPPEHPGLKSAMYDLGIVDDTVKLIKFKSRDSQNPLDTMISLRSRFFNLMEDSVLSGNDRRIAATIHSAMTDSMMHPNNLGAREVAIWRRAANRTKFRESIQAKTYLRMIVNSDTPEKIARHLTDSGNISASRNVKRWLKAAGQEDKWVAVQDAFRNLLMDEPSAIRGILTGKNTKATKGFDPIMDEGEREIYLGIGDNISKIRRGTLNKMLKDGRDEASRLTRLVENGTRQELRDFLEVVGGKETARGQWLAASVISSLYNKSTKTGTLKQILDKNIFLKGLEGFRRRGIMEDLFTPEQLRRLDDYEAAFTFLPESVGQADLMATAAIASSANSIVVGQPAKAFGGFRGFLKNDIMAWMLMTKGKMLVGGTKKIKPRGKKAMTPAQARVFGGALGVVVGNMEEISGRLEEFFGFDERGIGSLETPQEFREGLGISDEEFDSIPGLR